MTGLPPAHPGWRIGLFGGSFDPPHEGHVLLTRAALRGFGLDRVWWIVSPGNPLKAHAPAPMAERITAARQLIRDPRVVVTGIEAELGTRLTADTIALLQSRCPGVHFVWLMGSDNLIQFDRWERWREIAARVPLGIVARPGSRLKARLSPAAQKMWPWRLPPARARELALSSPPVWTLIDMPMSKMSSTAIRAQQASGRSSGDGSGTAPSKD